MRPAGIFPILELLKTRIRKTKVEIKHFGFISRALKYSLIQEYYCQ